jgi:hypothetical protein
MRRTTTFAALAVALLAPLSAAADAPASGEVADEMCDEFGHMVEWTTPRSSERPATQALWSLSPEPARRATAQPEGAQPPRVARHIPLDVEDTLWCLTRDDPRCCPIDNGQGGSDVKVRDAATTSPADDIAGPLEILPSQRGTARGGPRDAHGSELERPPQL